MDFKYTYIIPNMYSTLLHFLAFCFNGIHLVFLFAWKGNCVRHFSQLNDFWPRFIMPKKHSHSQTHSTRKSLVWLWTLHLFNSKLHWQFLQFSNINDVFMSAISFFFCHRHRGFKFKLEKRSSQNGTFVVWNCNAKKVIDTQKLALLSFSRSQGKWIVKNGDKT